MPMRPYFDPGIRDCPAAYAGFLRRLAAVSMVDFQLEPATEQVGFFGVEKKAGRARLVVDCRRSNVHFRAPAKVRQNTKVIWSGGGGCRRRRSGCASRQTPRPQCCERSPSGNALAIVRPGAGRVAKRKGIAGMQGEHGR